MSAPTELMAAFADSVEANNSATFTAKCHEIITNAANEATLRSTLRISLDQIKNYFEMDNGVLDEMLTSAYLEKEFFNTISQLDTATTRYVLSAIEFVSDDLFSPTVIDKEFFVDLSAYLQQHCIQPGTSLHLLNIPFVWKFNGPVPFKALHTLSQQVLTEISKGPVLRGQSSVLFKDNASLISSDINGSSSFWLFAIKVIPLDEKSYEFKVPYVDEIVQEDEYINTHDADDFMHDKYGVYMPKIDIQPLATVVTEQIEDFCNNQFLETLTDIVYSGVAKQHDFKVEIAGVNIEGNGRAFVKLYSDSFENTIQIPFDYSDWFPDSIVESVIMTSLENFIDNNPRYSRFIELPSYAEDDEESDS